MCRGIKASAFLWIIKQLNYFKMPQIINMDGKSNIVKVETNPNRKATVKVKMESMTLAGGQPKVITKEDGTKKFHYTDKDPKRLTRLPNTVVIYTAAIGKNGLITGLDELVDNPYKDLDYYRPGWEPILKGNKKIRRQEMLEYKHEKPMGYYTSNISTVMPSNKVSELPFYQRPESRVPLNDGVTFFDLNNQIHEANYYMLRAHKMIANSYEELKFNPRATHYIVDETERSNIEAEAVRKMNKFGARLEEIMSLNDSTIQDFCKALEIRGMGTTMTDCYTALSEFARRSDDKYEEFMDIYELWKDPITREVFEGHVETYNLLTVPGLLTTRNNKLFWSQPAGDGGKKQLWEWKSKDQFIRQFLLDPKYQDEVDVLRSLYNAKTRY